MQTARRPYWSWSLDRWNLLVAILLAVLLVVVNARLGGEPAQVVAPAMQVSGAAPAVGEPLLLEGTGTPGSTVKVYDGETVVAETTVGADGTWQVEVPPLAPGEHSFVAKLLGADGKEQAASAPVELTVADGQIVMATVVPSAPTAARTPEIRRPEVATLKVGEPITLSGTGAPGTAVTLYDGDVVFAETTVAPDGTWQMTVPPLGAGAHSLTTSMLVIDGKEQFGSAPVEQAVAEGQKVGAAPAAVARSKRSLASLRPSRRNVGATPAAGRQSSEPQMLDGTGTPGATVTVYDGDEPIASTTVAPDGTWSLTVPPLADGTHNLVAKQVGADGQAQGESTPLELAVVDGQVLVTPPTAGLWAGEPPTLEGVGTPGATVTVYANGVAVAQSTVAPDGTWTMPLPPQEVARALAAPGATNATPTVTAGTAVSPAAAATAVPGAGAPAVVAPAIKRPAAGLSAGEALTLEGTGTPGMRVQVVDGARVVGEGVVGPDGTWQVTVPPLAPGEHSLVAKQVGADDTAQGASAPLELTVADGQIAVATPVAGAPAVVAPLIKRPAAGLSAGEPLMLEGTGTPGMRVQVVDGARVVGEGVVGPDGTWQVEVPPLAPGEHSLVAKQVGADDTAQGASAPLELTVADGQIAVATPMAGAPAVVAPLIKRPAAGLRADEALTLEGTGTPGMRVQVVDGARVVGEGVVGPDGTWQVEVPPLAPGEHSLVAKQVGADDTAQGASMPLELTVADGKIAVATPVAGAPATPVPGAGAPLTLEGAGAPGSTVKVYDGDAQIGEATVGADGKWKLTLPALAVGAHTLMAKLFGTDGKEQATSQPLSVVIPAQPGEAAVILPAIVLPADIEFKADAPVELAGTAAPGAKIKLYDGSKLVGEATVDASGNWKMSVSPLAIGEHVLTAVTYGTDGQAEGSSKPLTVTVSAAQPPAGQPSIAWPLDGSAVVSARPLLTGQAFPGGVVSVFDGEKLLGETLADGNGRWSFRPSVPLSPGQHVLTVAATTPDGQTTVESSPVSISVGARTVVIPSRKPPSGAAPAFVTPADGGIVNTAQPLFAGTAAPGAAVRLYDGAKVLGETTADSDGRWSFRPSAPLAEGEHTVTAVVLNADGTESAAKSSLTLTVASGLGQKPAQPLLLASALPAILSNNRPALTGQASPGAAVRIYDGDQLVGEVNAGPDGSWYFVPTAPLAPGEHVLRVEVVGPDGAKQASAEYPVTVVEGAKPVEPPKVVVPAQGQVAPGDVLSGTAPAGSRVRIYDGDTLIGTTTAGANGKWRFKLPKNLAAGQHVFRAAVLDQAEAPVSHSPSVPLKVVPPATLPVTGATFRGR